MRYPRLLTVFVVSVGIFSLLLMGFLFIKPPSDDADIPHCRSIYMYPSYARLDGFDETHTPLASKYSLYFYREQGVDYDPDQLKGTPVLFIPGNAGSFRQVRSIAAQAANLYRDSAKEFVGPLDFFTADFNEDFTAFHGRTLMDQAQFLNHAIKYILRLYKDNKNPPQSVILLAHSMGGIVARLLLSLDSYIHKSVNTIVTLSSPHSAAPLTFDGDILRAYSLADRFWYEGFNSDDNKLAIETLEDVSLISITGGSTDTTLPADYTTLGFLVPPSHGFTVFTSGIPGVWTPMDHLAIVWCDQLRRSVARVLLDILDSSTESGVLPLTDRMNIFRKSFLTGFEKNYKNILDKTNAIEFDDDSIQFELVSSLAVSSKYKEGKSSGFYGFEINEKDPKGPEFSLLSSLNMEKWNIAEDSLQVLLCKKTSSANPENDAHEKVDVQKRTKSNYRCTDTFNMATIVPKSNVPLEDSSFGGEFSPYSSLQLGNLHLREYDIVLVKMPTKESKRDDFFLTAKFNNDVEEYDLGRSNSLHFFWGKSSIQYDISNSLVLKVYVSNARSSLFAYNLDIKFSNGNEEEKNHASAILRQFVEEPFESKWHTNLQKSNSLVLTMHGIAPYTPFRVNKRHDLTLELWNPNINDNQGKSQLVTFSISLNYFETFRLLMLRYRLALVAYTILVVLIAFIFQYCFYIQNRVFPSVSFGLSKICSMKALRIIVIVTAFLNPIVNKRIVQRFLDFIDPVVFQDANEINKLLNRDFKLNSFYLGLEESYMILLGPIFFFASVVLVWITFYVALSISIIVSTVSRYTRKRTDIKNKDTTDNVSLYDLNSKSIDTSPSNEEEDIRDQNISLRMDEATDANNDLSISMSSTPSATLSKKILVNVILLFAIALLIPYQFAYVICCLIQILLCIKLSWSLPFTLNTRSQLNFMVTILLLMLWTLPINVPVLIVYGHNLAVNWRTPFSSHHNILAILPIMLLVQGHLFGQILPSINSSKKYKSVTYWYLGIYIFYCALYGVRHTFWLHHLFNVFACWLVVLRF